MSKKLKQIIKVPDNIRVIFYNPPGTATKCHEGLDICCTSAKNCIINGWITIIGLMERIKYQIIKEELMRVLL